ncbi:MAG: M1 family metallopeptidase [Pirellulaceae bacterium]|nr:M1 family metallopeptidase [Pirellulaceae bacterium]
MNFQKRLFYFFVAGFTWWTPVNAEENICRYCAEGREHEWSIGLELDGSNQYAPDRQVDVKHIKLDVTPDFLKRTVSGTASITAVPISKPVSILRLDATDLSVKDVRCDGAKVADFVSTRNDLQIAFADPIALGTEIIVHIDYSAQPMAGLYFRTPEMGYPATDTHIWTQGETHEARNWFPCFDYPNERSTTEVICHVPKGMTVLSNGRRIGEEIDNRGLTAVRWKQELPHPNYLICLVAGNLEKLEKQHRNVPLGFYTQPSLAEHAENSFRDTPEIMKFYEEEIGLPFPWPKYDQVTILDFTAGGMENTTLTTLTSNTIFSEETENIRSSRALDAHEMAHQWFGDYVTCKDWSHLWLNEGFATFYTHLYEGHAHGRDAMLYGLYTDANNKILNQKDDKRPVVFRGYMNSQEQFDYRSYLKGSWVLHMLRSQLGPDLYRKAIRTYLEKHALTSVVSDDLRQVIEELSGRSMDRFFDQWLYHARHPDIKVSYTWLLNEKLAKVTIEQTQKISEDVMLFEFPTKLRFIVDGKVIDHSIEVTKTHEDFYFPLEAKPSVVRFDPEFTVLADVTFDLPAELVQAQLENADDMLGRLLACKTLGNRKTHESERMLEKVLNEDVFYGVRIAAANALAMHASDEAFDILERTWKNQTDARVRLSVVDKITSRFSERIPKLIAEILAVERNPAILASVIKALGKFHGEESQHWIVTYLQSSSFRNELAVAAISAMRQQNDPSNQQVLMKILKQNERQFSSANFGQGLDTLAHVSKALSDKHEVRDFLLQYLNHPKSKIRSTAMFALGELGDATAISVLESFTNSNDLGISRTAQRAIDQLRESKPTVPKELVELRKDMATLKKETERMQADLKDLRDQQKAKK